MRTALFVLVATAAVPLALAQGEISKPPTSKDEAVIQAIRNLSSDVPQERVKAAAFFIDHPDPRALQALLRCSDYHIETSEEVRVNAVRALGEIGMKEAYEPLLKITKDEPRDTVKWVAILSLGKIHEPRAFDQLREWIEKPGPGPAAADWRFLAAYAIGYTRDKRALTVLDAALGDKDKRVRRDAARGLEAYGSPEGCDILLSHIELETSGETMAAMVKALRELKCQQAIPVFQKLKAKLDTNDGEFKQMDQVMDAAAEVIKKSAASSSSSS